MKTISPLCPKCKSDTFELRLLRDEAVATAHCDSCSADYLLLDSEDYWFDVIQQGYPRVTRCSCKNKSFRLRLDYSIRDDGDVDYIETHSICAACGKTRRQLSFDVDYGGTDHLIKKPLVPCKNPKILYDLKDLSLFVMLFDMLRIFDFLAEQGCSFFSRVRRDNRWENIHQDAAEAKATVEGGNYFFIYAMPDHEEVSEDQVNTIKEEDAFWKRNEVIRIGSKSHLCMQQFGDNPPSLCYSSNPSTFASDTEIGLSFKINYSNEFVRGEEVVKKSERFQKVTANLLTKLQEEFVSWRSKYCFDNPDVNIRAFGDRFRKKSKQS